jgi:hypothetical protein
VNRYHALWIALLSLGMFAGGVAVAQIDPGMWGRHPNLRDADKDCLNAQEHIHKAQAANDWDMQGHAARAQGLLTQAEQEIRAACLAADHR